MACRAVGLKSDDLIPRFAISVLFYLVSADVAEKSCSFVMLLFSHLGPKANYDRPGLMDRLTHGKAESIQLISAT